MYMFVKKGQGRNAPAAPLLAPKGLPRPPRPCCCPKGLNGKPPF